MEPSSAWIRRWTWREKIAIRYCDASVLEHTAAVEVIVCDSIRPTVRYTNTGTQLLLARRRHYCYYAVRCRQLVAPPAHAVGDDFRPAARRARWPARGRCALPPAGAATTTLSHAAATALAPPPVVQTAGRCSPRHPWRRDNNADACRQLSRRCRQRRSPGLQPVTRPRWYRRRQTAATIADRRPFTPPRAHTRRLGSTPPTLPAGTARRY